MENAETVASGQNVCGDRGLLDWMEVQYHASAKAMLRSISATDLVKVRRGFGQTIRPMKGSVLASPVLASYDPDPDYFFHWVRDSAVIMDALRRLIDAGTIGREALGLFRDFLEFSLTLSKLDGSAFLAEAGKFRENVAPFFLQYVRSDSDLLNITGDAALGEPRFNPDGSIDILKWSRPQHDGPALRALMLLRFCASNAADVVDASALARALIEQDLEFTFRHWREPSFDIWEEELGRHYYTRLVQHAALAEGASWLDEIGAPARADHYRTAAQEILQSLDEYWSAEKGLYLSRLGVESASLEKDLDIATILAVIHAGRKQGAHSILDPRALATLARLEAMFAALYPINQACPAGRAPAMGRYAGDRYYSGGAYYFSTLGAAQFYFNLAEAAAGAAIDITPETSDIWHRLGADSIKNERLAFGLLPSNHRSNIFESLLQRGDMFMATVAAYTPPSGELSEQFDQATGAQTSAKSLAWSHAAFITAFASRAAAVARFCASGASR